MKDGLDVMKTQDGFSNVSFHESTTNSVRAPCPMSAGGASGSASKQGATSEPFLGVVSWVLLAHSQRRRSISHLAREEYSQSTPCVTLLGPF